MRPSAKTRVLTLSPSASSQSSAAACLCGIVTFAPAKPAAASPRTAVAQLLGRDVERDVRPVEPAAAKAAFCICGESECATGCPSSATTRVDAVITVMAVALS